MKIVRQVSPFSLFVDNLTNTTHPYTIATRIDVVPLLTCYLQGPVDNMRLVLLYKSW